jgi:xanthine dehydrogenase accessory factor
VSKELELWQFIASRLKNDERVMLLVVAESSGSSPGRAGYKMAVAADGELVGSIGGGVMEVRLVEQAKAILSEPGAVATGFLVEQVHQKNAPNSSGMICSGRQTVIAKELSFDDLKTVEDAIDCLQNGATRVLEISNSSFQVIANTQDIAPFIFETSSETEFVHQERLSYKHRLFIIGGGHCALALSELMSKMEFRVSIFDDRPDLNTLEKNRFAHEITIIDSYETVGDFIESGDENYVVVMTIGYAFDEIVIRKLFEKNFKYFGVLGSKAKMKTLLKTLEKDGFDKHRLAKIHTPIGMPINSRTPEEIAVSIAAEIISVKNAD